MPPQRHLSDRQKKKDHERRKTLAHSKKVKHRHTNPLQDDVSSHRFCGEDVSTRTMMLQLKSAHSQSHNNLCRMLKLAIQYGIQQGAIKTRLVRTIDMCDSDGSTMDLLQTPEILPASICDGYELLPSQDPPPPLSTSGFFHNLVSFLVDPVSALGKLFMNEDAAQAKRFCVHPPRIVSPLESSSSGSPLISDEDSSRDRKKKTV